MSEFYSFKIIFVVGKNYQESLIRANNNFILINIFNFIEIFKMRRFKD